MTHFKRNWWRSVWPYLITASVAIIVTLIITGYVAYVALGSLPLIGGAIQNKMRTKLWLPKKKTRKIAPGRGIGNKKRREDR